MGMILAGVPAEGVTLPSEQVLRIFLEPGARLIRDSRSNYTYLRPHLFPGKIAGIVYIPSATSREKESGDPGWGEEGGDGGGL